MSPPRPVGVSGRGPDRGWPAARWVLLAGLLGGTAVAGTAARGAGPVLGSPGAPGIAGAIRDVPVASGTGLTPASPAPRPSPTATLRIEPGATWDADPWPTFGGWSLRVWGSGIPLAPQAAAFPTDLVRAAGVRVEARGVQVLSLGLQPEVDRVSAERLEDPPRLRLRFLRRSPPGGVAPAPGPGGAGGPDLSATLDLAPPEALPARWGWLPLLVGPDSLVESDFRADPHFPLPLPGDGVPLGLRVDLARHPGLARALERPPPGRPDAVFRELSGALGPPGAPPRPERDWALALGALAAGDAGATPRYVDAAHLFLLAAGRDPDAPLARWGRAMAGVSYARAGAAGEALLYLDRVLAEDPGAPDARRLAAARAQVALLRGSSEVDARALAGFLPALDGAEAFAAARFLAWTRTRDGWPDQGAAVLDAVRQRWPDAWVLARHAALHGEVLYRAGRYDEADAMFARAAARGGQDAAIAASRRVDCAAARSDIEGIVQARRALESLPGIGATRAGAELRDLAEFREAAARAADGGLASVVEALVPLRRIAARLPGAPAAVEESLVEAELALRQGDLAAALGRVSPLLGPGLPPPVRARWERWTCAAAADRIAEAAHADEPAAVAEVYEGFLARGGDPACDRPDLLPLVAAAYETLRLPGRAAEILAPALGRPLPAALRASLTAALARALVDAGRPADAEQVATALLEATAGTEGDPPDTPGLATGGTIIGPAPGDGAVAEALLARGRARLALHRAREAEPDLRRVMEVGSDAARDDAARILAGVAARDARFGPAAALLAGVVGEAPWREASPDDLLLYGRALLRAGRARDAIGPLAAARTRGASPDGKRASEFLLAEALAGVGRRVEADSLRDRLAGGGDLWARLAREDRGRAGGGEVAGRRR